MCFVTKAMPISYIDSKCQIKKLRTCLVTQGAYHITSYSCPWGRTHTHTHAHTHTQTLFGKVISINQVGPVRTWFKASFDWTSQNYLPISLYHYYNIIPYMNNCCMYVSQDSPLIKMNFYPSYLKNIIFVLMVNYFMYTEKMMHNMKYIR